jgi:hypothetical protein
MPFGRSSIVGMVASVHRPSDGWGWRPSTSPIGWLSVSPLGRQDLTSGGIELDAIPLTYCKSRTIAGILLLDVRASAISASA